jgi:hypothetical protein
MSRIRGKDTTPERIVRSLLHRLGHRFRLHVRIGGRSAECGTRNAEFKAHSAAATLSASDGERGWG